MGLNSRWQHLYMETSDGTLSTSGSFCRVPVCVSVVLSSPDWQKTLTQVLGRSQTLFRKIRPRIFNKLSLKCHTQSKSLPHIIVGPDLVGSGSMEPQLKPLIVPRPPAQHCGKWRSVMGDEFNSGLYICIYTDPQGLQFALSLRQQKKGNIVDVVGLFTVLNSMMQSLYF